MCESWNTTEIWCIAGQWFKSCLPNRKQQVGIKSAPSDFKTSHRSIVKHGILPGSLLVPLHFFIYISDLHTTINFQSKPIFFVEDATTVSHPEIDCFQHCANYISAGLNKWFETNKYTLNFDKSYNILILTSKLVLI